MQFAFKLALKIFFLGLVILVISIMVFQRINYYTLLTHQIEHSEHLSDEISSGLNRYLSEKIKTMEMLSRSPIINDALITSNADYQSASKEERDTRIRNQNNRWKEAKNESDPFILDYTKTRLSQFFKDQQKSVKDEIGEIFLTNKYGALVASTGKLTTFSHGYKYWWIRAYNEGKGAVFLDDRGYDESVSGYVIGMVIPIKNGSEILGILKVNMNILGTIDETLIDSRLGKLEKLILIRSGGAVVFEEGIEPLSTEISPHILDKMRIEQGKSFIYSDEGKEWLIAYSSVELTVCTEGYHFGGNIKSIDHKKGNLDESWYIMDFYPLSIISDHSMDAMKNFLFMGLNLLFILAIVSYLIGISAAKPIKELIKKTKSIAKGDFNTQIDLNRRDEFGNLGASFNDMAKKLANTTTTIIKLNESIHQRKEVEDKLQENQQRLIQAQKIANIGHWEFDIVRNTLIWSDEIFRIFDLNPQNFNASYDNFMEITHPEDREYVDKIYRDTIKTKTPYNIIHRLRLKNGDIKYVNEICSTDYDENDRPLRFLGTIQDITERIVADKEILKNKNLAERYLNIAAEIIVSLDVSGNITLLNESGYTLLGYRPGELIGQNWFDTCLEKSDSIDQTKIFSKLLRG